MVLAVLSLLRERLPCSENYWRYKRNYEMHMKIINGDQDGQGGGGSSINEEVKSSTGGGAVKKLAKAHMSFVMPLSPYNQHRKGFFQGPVSPGRGAARNDEPA